MAGALPAADMARMIGLLGSGPIMSLIVPFVAVAGLARVRMCTPARRRGQGGLRGGGADHSPTPSPCWWRSSVFRGSGFVMDYLVAGIRQVVLALGPECRLPCRPLPVGPDEDPQRAAPAADGGCDDDLRRGFIPGRLAAISPGFLRPRPPLAYWRCTRQRQHHPHPCRGLRPDRRSGRGQAIL